MNDLQTPSSPLIVLQLQEEERQRTAQALMNGPGQLLANALTELEYAIPLVKQKPDSATAGLTALCDELRVGLGALQAYVAELTPPLLSEMGLGPSIKQYTTRYGERTGIRTACRGCGSSVGRYPAAIELVLFRILQEGLTNVEKHSGATMVRVSLTERATHLRLVIHDNGRGFILRPHTPSKKRQLGLIAMRDRAELLGGHVQLFSEPNSGVRVMVTIPYHGRAIDPRGQGGHRRHGNNHQTSTNTVRARSRRQAKIKTRTRERKPRRQSESAQKRNNRR